MNPRLGYFLKRASWYTLALIFALALNFVLPRLGPVSPVDVIISQINTEGMTPAQVQEMREVYRVAFHLDQSLGDQFLNYITGVFQGNLGVSSISYPRTVWEIISQALPWTIALVFPAIVLAWILGNALGVFAAFKRGIFDRLLYPLALFFASIPFFCFGLLLVSAFYVELGWVESLGAYSPGISPSYTMAFFQDALSHYWLPFLSIFLIIVGGQAIGMRSLAIYELGSDYVKYAQSMGVTDRRILYYVFRNAMLPQLTGLALALGAMVGGSLITELVFSYPGIGHLMLTAIRKNDYPLIQGITLLVTLSVLFLNFTVDVLVGIFDPRVQAGSTEGKA